MTAAEPMRRTRRAQRITQVLTVVSLLCFVLGPPRAASAQMTGGPDGYKQEPGQPSSALPAPLREIGFDQNLSRLVPLDAIFRH
jgi:hypothetical protein